MDNEAITLGFLQIRWYSIFILFAVCVASLVIIDETNKKKIDKDMMLNIIFYGLLIGIAGARIYYVLFNLDYYLMYPSEIICIWHGGLAIHGGLITTLIFLYFYSKKKKLNLLLLLDILVVGIILAQSIGRWGNFFNGEAFGREVSRAFLVNLHLPKFIIEGMYIDGAYREPTFLYESLLSLLGFMILVLVRRRKSIKTGTLTSIYLLWYGITRCIIETFRSDSLTLGPIKIAQLVSILGLIMGIILMIRTKNNKEYKLDTIIQKEEEDTKCTKKL